MVRLGWKPPQDLRTGVDSQAAFIAFVHSSLQAILNIEETGGGFRDALLHDALIQFWQVLAALSPQTT